MSEKIPITFVMTNRLNRRDLKDDFVITNSQHIKSSCTNIGTLKAELPTQDDSIRVSWLIHLSDSSGDSDG